MRIRACLLFWHKERRDFEREACKYDLLTVIPSQMDEGFYLLFRAMPLESEPDAWAKLDWETVAEEFKAVLTSKLGLTGEKLKWGNIPDNAGLRWLWADCPKVLQKSVVDFNMKEP